MGRRHKHTEMIEHSDDNCHGDRHDHYHEHLRDHCDRTDHCSCGDEHHGGGTVFETASAVLLFAAGLAVKAWTSGPAGSAGLIWPGLTWPDLTWHVLLLASYALAGWRVLLGAVRNILRGRVFDENFLMTVASLGAIAIGEIPEAVGVMVFFSVGEIFQDMAVQRSRGSIRALMDIRPDWANVMHNGAIERVSPKTVRPGDTILVAPGERIPLDGTVCEGDSSVDTSALTGESMPRSVTVGDQVLAGMVNTVGTLTITVDRPYSDSAVSRVLALVEEASGRKAHTERFITTFSRYYTPAVVGLAALIAVVPPMMLGQQYAWYAWLHRALVLLVISCPCALVISIPLGYYAGIGGASRRGVLIKGANYLEALSQVDTVVFDKTGTLTKGSFEVVEVTTENGFSQEDVLEFAAHAGAHSTHPVSASIRETYETARRVDHSSIAECDEIGGCGVRAVYKGQRVIAGNDRLLHRENVAHDRCVTDGTVVNVAKEGTLAGRIRLADEVKPDAASAVRRLREAGVQRVIMLTGDVHENAERVAGQVGIDEYTADLLPDGKVAALEGIMAAHEEGDAAHGHGPRRAAKVAFVGDGINDAPVLTRADVGIAMGGLGSDAAIEAADVVIMDDNPVRVADAIDVARHTRSIVIQNVVLALSVKGIVMALGIVGAASMWSAVFADVGVALIAVLNAARAYGGRDIRRT